MQGYRWNGRAWVRPHLGQHGQIIGWWQRTSRGEIYIPVTPTYTRRLPQSRKNFFPVILGVLVILLVVGLIFSGSLQGFFPKQESDMGKPKPLVLAEEAYLYDPSTQTELFSQNATAHVSVWSTTKLMTALLVAEHEPDFTKSVTIDATMWGDIVAHSHLPGATLLGIGQGETYTLKDLLYGLFWLSGNDTAVALADAVNRDDYQGFINEMNQKASELQLNDTAYVNPNGLDEGPGQYSCAHDLAILLTEVMKHNSLTSIMRDTGTYKRFPDMKNGNQFVYWYPGADGGKTGFDGQRDFVQAESVTRNGRELIGAVIQTINWWTDLRDLFNWGFNDFSWHSPADALAQGIAVPFAIDSNDFVRDRKDNVIANGDNGLFVIKANQLPSSVLQVYFPATGFMLSGAILVYFLSHGGFNAFGYPRSRDNNGVQEFDLRVISCKDTSCSDTKKHE